LHAALARAVLQSQHRADMLQQCAQLCPQTLDELPCEMVQQMRSTHAATLERLSQIDAEACAASETKAKLPADNLLRLLLAMQMNAFQSGLYLQLAMINHSWTPNCVKLANERCAGCTAETCTSRCTTPGCM
jgi:hypothetical protein